MALADDAGHSAQTLLVEVVARDGRGAPDPRVRSTSMASLPARRGSRAAHPGGRWMGVARWPLANCPTQQASWVPWRA